MAQRIDSGHDAMRQLAILNRIARIAVEDMALRPMLQRVVDTLAEEFQWEFVACAGIDAANHLPAADLATALVQADRLRLAMEARAFEHRYCAAGW